MSRSIIIRHSKTEKEWFTLSYTDLLKLLNGEYDIGVDEDYLSSHFDPAMLSDLKIEKVYSSPAKRAKQTAKIIADSLGVGTGVAGWLSEIKFEMLPREVYERGKEAMREFLLEESKKAAVDIDGKMLVENAIFVSHGFVMRRFFEKLYGTQIDELKSDGRFTNYLTGFETGSGSLVSCLKQD